MSPATIIAYAEDDQLVQATQVVHFIATEGTGYPPPLVHNLEPEPPQRFLEISIECVGTAIVVSFFNKVAGDWVKTGSTVQVRLPSSSSYVSGTTQRARTRGAIRMKDAGVGNPTPRTPHQHLKWALVPIGSVLQRHRAAGAGRRRARIAAL